jgi:hypothetical protein
MRDCERVTRGEPFEQRVDGRRPTVPPMLPAPSISPWPPQSSEQAVLLQDVRGVVLGDQHSRQGNDRL